MIQELIKLQNKIYVFYSKDHPYNLEYSPRISFSKIGDLYEINFYGEGFDDDYKIHSSNFGEGLNFGFCALLDFLTENSNAIISLNFVGPDQGANGTKSWDFNRLLNSNATFRNLKSFSVQPTDLGDHNQSIIDGELMEENGIIAKLISRMPILERLVVPSAPDNSFFDIGEHPLRFLKIQAGYSHQNFIENLSKSKNFKCLTALDYTDLIDVYDIPSVDYTSFDSFLKLFKSEAFSSVRHFKLRNAKLDDEQLCKLQQLNKVQFLNIRANGGRYVNHLMS